MTPRVYDPLYVYVAGPLSQNQALGVREAVRVAEQLVEWGHVPYIPHLVHLWDLASPVHHEYEFWMQQDWAWLRRCDVLVRLPGHSPGADREVGWADEMGMRVLAWTDLTIAGMFTNPVWVSNHRRHP